MEQSKEIEKLTQNSEKNQLKEIEQLKNMEKIPQENQVLEQNTLFFLVAAALYASCFAVAFYKNFAGITYPLITAATMAICGLFLKKSGMVWKKTDWYYGAAAILLGISTVLTTNGFVIFFNTAGILLLVTVFMIGHIYHDQGWNLGQYICNLLFLYVCMIPELASPFVKLGKYVRKNKVENRHNKNIKYIVFGFLLGIPMVLFVIALLSSADLIFSNYIGSIFNSFFGKNLFSSNLFFIILLLLLGFFGIYSFLSSLTLNNIPQWKNQREKKNPITAITFTSMITVIYVIFCGIQLVFLFTGGRMLPEGYTYASYAHQGFFQLLFICIFNLILVISCIAVFQRNKILKFVLLVFSVCTYIIIGSSAYRMILYIRVYHLSFLRILVLWFLALLVLLMFGVIINIVREKFELFRYSMAMATVCYLIFSFGRSDYITASYNIEKMGDTISNADINYLCSLSLDAAPALQKLNLQHEKDEYRVESEYNVDCKKCRLDYYFEDIWYSKNKITIRTWNLSKYQAQKAAKLYLEIEND